MSGFFVSTAHAAITTINLTSPDGGQMWRGTQNIVWSTDGTTGDQVEISYSTDNFTSIIVLVDTVAYNGSPYAWGTTVPDGASYKIRVKNIANSAQDQSTSNFTVDNTDPVTTLTIDPIDGINGWYVTVPTMSLSCADTGGTGCFKTFYRWDSGAWVDNLVIPVVASEGSHLLEYYSDDNATDALGARNIETVQTQTIKVDTIVPTVALSSATANPTNGMISVVAQFSETVTGFDQTDIVVGGGAVDSFVVVDGVTYNFNVDPTDGASVAVTIDVNASVADDIAGNDNTASNQLAYTSDTVAPTISITLGDDALMIGDTSLLTFTFSEGPTGFDVADITAPNGLLSGFTVTGNPLIYTALFTPNAGVEVAVNVVTVGTGWTDAATNAPTGSTNSLNYAIDTLAPTAVITYSDTDALVKSGDSLIITATFSEPIGIVQDMQIAISGVNTVAATDMTLVDSTHYTYTHIVGAGDGVATVALSNGLDVAGNAVVSAPTSGATFTVDNTAPTLVITMDDVALNIGDTSLVTFTWSEPVVGFDNADITTIENGTLSTVATSGDIVFTATFTPNAGVEVASNVITVDKTGVTDVATNAGVGTENSPTYAIDTIAPTVSNITTKDADTDGEVDTATIVFSEAMLDSTFATGGDWTIGGTAGTGITTGTIDDNTLNITHGGVAGTNVKDVLYTAGTVTDLAGNLLANVASGDVAEVDAAGPVLLSAITTSITTINATFSEDLNGATVTNADFTVSGNTLIAPDAAETTPTSGIVILNLLTPMGTGDTPLVSLVGTVTDNPSAGSNSSPSGQSVTAVDGVAPVLTSVSISSNNVSTTLAKAGDVVTLTFTSSEIIATPAALIQGAATAISGSGTNWTAFRTMTGTDNPQGTLTFMIGFTDVATPSNSGVSVTATIDGSSVFFDRTAPTVDAGTDKEVNATVNQFATTSDSAPASGIATYLWQNLTPLVGAITFGTNTAEDTTISADTEGTYTIRLTVTDNAGNIAFDEMTFIWDTSAPELLTHSPAASATGVLVGASTATVTFNEDIVLINASKVLLVNNSTSASYKGTVAVNGGDGNSAVLNIPYNGLDSGTMYRINVFGSAVRDVAGNVASQTVLTSFFTTEADTVVPVINSLSAGSITETGATLNVITNESATCKYSATDSDYASMITMTTTGGTSHSQEITGLTASTPYTYFVRCQDTSGNTMTISGVASFPTLAPAADTTAPVAPAITTVSATTDANTYTIAGTVADDGGTRTITLYNGVADAGSATIPTGDTTWAILVPLVQDAVNSFTATATDEADNVSVASLAVVITEATATGDTEAPPAPIITTLPATIDADNYTISGTAGVDLPVDGTRVVTIYRNLSYGPTIIVGSLSLLAGETDWSFVAPLVQNTLNYFTANSTDEAGNTSAVSNIRIITEVATLDTTAPVITLLGANPLTLIEGDPYTDPGATASDNVDGDISGSMVVGGDPVDTGTPGTYTVTYNVSDAATNAATQETRTVIVNAAFDDTATLAVTGISTTKSYASDTDLFPDGWSWTFLVTVPTGETEFAMKFADFVSGANTISAASNIRYYTAQSTEADTVGEAVTIAGANTYPGSITLDGDLDAGTAGRQIAVTVEMKVPAGSAGGSYSASYGVKADTVVF